MFPTVGQLSIEQRLGKHIHIALFFSGGKDSMACLYLLRNHWDQITVYHANSGDTLPEMDEVIHRIQDVVPHFVQLDVHVPEWIAQHGLPTDLLPYSAHPIGLAVDVPKTRLVSRYDCCYHNLMLPLWQRARADECSMIIRGVKRCDTARMAAEDGSIHEGMELFYPIQEWTDEKVMIYLRLSGVRPSKTYDHLRHGLDCATCPAWLSEERGKYLKEFHPELHKRYDARLQLVIDEVAPVLAALKHEAEAGVG